MRKRSSDDWRLLFLKSIIALLCLVLIWGLCDLVLKKKVNYASKLHFYQEGTLLGQENE